MSLTGLITFTAGTKAKASEVNTNFSLVKSFVDTNESNIATNTSDIETLDSGKAGVNGDATNRFAVADAVNNTDAVNKQTAFAYIYNGRRYIDGFKIAKTASDTISVASGSCYDSTFEQIMYLASPSSIQNTTQSLNTTYYVYVVAKTNGADPQVIISTSSTTPALPSGYTLYRCVGKYSTLTDGVSTTVNAISDVTSYSTPNTEIAPDYSAGSTKTAYYYNGSSYVPYEYTAQSDGFIWVKNTIYSSSAMSCYLTIDDVSFEYGYEQSGGDAHVSKHGLIMPIKKGSTYKATDSSGGSGANGRITLIFYPRKGVTG